ncbi:MAG: extracellular solute-binding protein, partial [Eubacteriales bacterium]
MKTKKILALLLSATMMVSALAGCGSSSTESTTETAEATTEVAEEAEEEEFVNTTVQEEIASSIVAEETDLTGEFTYWSSFTGDSQTWDQSRVDLFNELYADQGIYCDVQFVPDGAGVTNGKLLSAIAGGTAPDVFITDSPTAVYTYAANGSLEPLDEILDKVGINVDDFFEGCKDVIYYQDTAYLIPQDANVILLYYNPAIAEECGLDPDSPPTTIEELDAWGEAMTVQNDDGSYERFGFIPWLDSGADAFTVPYIYGCEIYDADTNELNLTEDQMVSYFEWIQSYAEKYDPEKISSFTSGLGGMFSPDHAFMTGKVAMTITGNWFTNALAIYAPDVEYR